MDMNKRAQFHLNDDNDYDDDHDQPVKALDALVGLVVELAVDWIALGIDHLEGVRSVSVHVPVPVGGAPIGKQEGHLVGGLRPQGDEVPEHVGVLQVGLGVALLGVDEAAKDGFP